MEQGVGAGKLCCVYLQDDDLRETLAALTMMEVNSSIEINSRKQMPPNSSQSLARGTSRTNINLVLRVVSVACRADAIRFRIKIKIKSSVQPIHD